MNLVLRKVKQQDFEQLYQLDKLSDPLHHWQQDYFGKDQTLVALIEDKIVGFVNYQITDVIDILRISTHVQYHRCGVASRLLNALKIKQLPMILEMRASNKAANVLYQRHGFSQITLRKGYYRNGENAIIMRFKMNN